MIDSIDMRTVGAQDSSVPLDGVRESETTNPSRSDSENTDILLGTMAKGGDLIPKPMPVEEELKSEAYEKSSRSTVIAGTQRAGEETEERGDEKKSEVGPSIHGEAAVVRPSGADKTGNGQNGTYSATTTKMDDSASSNTSIRKKSCLRKVSTGLSSVSTDKENGGESPDTPSTPGTPGSPGRKKVSFDQLTIREYPLILGDHPATTCGPPVTLSWEVQETYALPVEEYEDKAPPRRESQELKMPAAYRQALLRKSKIGEHEIRRAEAETQRAQHQRRLTTAMQEFEGVEIFMQSAARKFQRWKKGLAKKSKKSGVVEDLDLAEKWLQERKEQQRRLRRAKTDPLDKTSETVDSALVMDMSLPHYPVNKSKTSVDGRNGAKVLKRSHSTGSLKQQSASVSQVQMMRERALANQKAFGDSN